MSYVGITSDLKKENILCIHAYVKTWFHSCEDENMHHIDVCKDNIHHVNVDEENIHHINTELGEE